MDINYRISTKIFGAILCVLGLAMLLPVGVGIFYREYESVKAFTKVLIPAIVIGTVLIKT